MDVNFGANAEIFISNINKEKYIEEKTITDHMKAVKDLEILEIKQMSHEDARCKSFLVSVKGTDRQKALTAELWPYGVRVREYRHFRSREENENRRSQQFQ